jgi:hypothetical protein
MKCSLLETVGWKMCCGQLKGEGGPLETPQEETFVFDYLKIYYMELTLIVCIFILPGLYNVVGIALAL